MIKLKNTTSMTPVATKGGIKCLIDTATGSAERTTSGWLEDEKFRWWFNATASTAAGKFDNTVTKTGKFTIKISATNATGRCSAVLGYNGVSAGTLLVPGLSKYGIFVKPNTTYRVTCGLKTLNNIGSGFNFAEFNSAGTRTTNSLQGITTGTNDWYTFTKDWTTGASTVWALIAISITSTGGAQTIWVDANSITIEEVTTITNSRSVPVLFFPKVTAVSSTDLVEQYLDYGGAYASTYALPAAIDEGAAHRQTFTPTRRLNSGVAVWPVSKGSGDWTMTLHDSSNNVMGAPSTITNGSVTAGEFLVFQNNFDWTEGELHFHITSTVADGTLKTNTLNDLEACSFRSLFYKNTGSFTIKTGTETLSYTCLSPTGWSNGTIVDTSRVPGIKPLTLGIGSNVVRYSMNGISLADPVMDSSHQGTVGGTFGVKKGKFDKKNLFFSGYRAGF